MMCKSKLEPLHRFLAFHSIRNLLFCGISVHLDTDYKLLVCNLYVSNTSTFVKELVPLKKFSGKETSIDPKVLKIGPEHESQ